jgi:acyl phosphate:glycerol-3-phosphate acyltransferase
MVSFLFKPFLRISEESKLSGAFYLMAGCLTAALIFPKIPAGMAILFLAFGDPAATLIGKWKGQKKWRGKSLEGSLACLAACTLAAIIAAACNVGLPPLVLASGILAATLLEVAPGPINDNFTLPIGSAAVMFAAGKLFT